jgi:predicted DNA-binding transcriptional regulator YafY
MGAKSTGWQSTPGKRDRLDLSQSGLEKPFDAAYAPETALCGRLLHRQNTLDAMYRRGDLGQVARAFRLMNALRGFRRGRTLAALAAEVDVSTRTIRRDLADLIDAGLKIEMTTVDGQPGARLIDRGFASVPITTRERFTLLAVRSVFDVLRGTPLHDDVESVLEKIEQGFDPDDAYERKALRARIAYVPDGGTKAYADKEDVIDALQTGIMSQKVVRYTYKDSRGRNQRGFVAPYAMLLYRQGLYVVGARLSEPGDGKNTSDWRRRLGNFAVERFSEAEHLRERTFDVPVDFELDELLHGAFGIHVTPSEPKRVVIEFSRERAALARARVWHPTQQVEQLADGRVRLAFSCVSIVPVVSWVLEWGPHARVIAPADLRAAVVDELERARALYVEC